MMLETFMDCNSDEKLTRTDAKTRNIYKRRYCFQACSQSYRPDIALEIMYQGSPDSHTENVDMMSMGES